LFAAPCADLSEWNSPHGGSSLSKTLSSYNNALLRSCEGAKFRALEDSMDKTNQWKTAALSPSTDDDALAKRLSVNWASSAPRRGQAAGQVLQKLRNGRVHAVAVESMRSRRRPVSLWIEQVVATRPLIARRFGQRAVLLPACRGAQMQAMTEQA
jgi:hypothetical protein